MSLIAAGVVVVLGLDPVMGQSVETPNTLLMAEARLKENGRDVTARLTYAKALEEGGRLADALDQYLLCFEGEEQTSRQHGGVRLVVIAELARLAADFLPARDALIKRQEASRDRILMGEASPTDPAVFTAINAHLGAIDDSLVVYRKVREVYDENITTRLLRECLVDALLDSRRYDQIGTLIDAAQRAELAYDQYQRDLARPLPRGADHDGFRLFARRTFIDRMVQYYEILVGARRLEDAYRVAAIVVDVDAGAETYYSLARAGLRTGRPGEIHADYAHNAIAQSNPPDAKMVETLANIMKHMGRNEDAALILEEHLDRPIRQALSRPVFKRPGAGCDGATTANGRTRRG